MTRVLALTAAVLLAAVPALARADDAKPTPTSPAAPAAATPAATPGTATPAATDQGSLSVSSTPAGKVFLDGADTGLTTPVVDLPVAPGKHTLKVVSADGREQTTEFDMESGGSLNLNLNLPEAAKVEEKKPVVEEKKPTAEEKKPEVKPEEKKPEATAEAPAPWTWMTVAGWTGLGLGTIGLLSGAVILTTPTDPDHDIGGPLGFGLFGAGVGLVIGGGVLLYLDTELADAGQPKPEKPADTAKPAKADAKTPKADAPKADAPKADAPKSDAPAADAPKADAPAPK
jgi:hypothetical protein